MHGDIHKRISLMCPQPGCFHILSNQLGYHTKSSHSSHTTCIQQKLHHWNVLKEKKYCQLFIRLAVPNLLMVFILTIWVGWGGKQRCFQKEQWVHPRILCAEARSSDDWVNKIGAPSSGQMKHLFTRYPIHLWNSQSLPMVTASSLDGFKRGLDKIIRRIGLLVAISHEGYMEPLWFRGNMQLNASYSETTVREGCSLHAQLIGFQKAYDWVV